MQILVHISILQRILCRLVGAGDGCIEMLQVLREADAHFKGIHSLLGGGSVATIGDRHAAAVHDGVMVVAALEGIAGLGGGPVGVWRGSELEVEVEVGRVRERHGGGGVK